MHDENEQRKKLEQTGHDLQRRLQYRPGPIDWDSEHEWHEPPPAQEKKGDAMFGVIEDGFLDELSKIAEAHSAQPVEKTSGWFLGSIGGAHGSRHDDRSGGRPYGGAASGAAVGHATDVVAHHLAEALRAGGHRNAANSVHLAELPASYLAGVAAGRGYTALKKKVLGKSDQEKTSADLTTSGREHIKAKNFALTAKQSDTGKPAYPIHDKAHAANALARVKQHGTPAQQSEVYKDVARRYPELAARSDVPALKAKAKHAEHKMTPAKELAFYNKHPHLSPALHGGLGTVAGAAFGALTAPKDKRLEYAAMHGLAGGAGGFAGAHFGQHIRKKHLEEMLEHKKKKAGVLEKLRPEAAELAGLGVLAVPGLDTLQAKIRSRKNPHEWEKKRLMGEGTHAALDVGGLGILGADTVRKALKGH